MANQGMPAERVDQLLQATGFIYEHVKLADQKALVFIALNGGLLGWLYAVTEKVPRGLTTPAVPAFALLLLAMALALMTIWPRRGRYARTKGALDPARIARFGDGGSYLDYLRNQSNEQFAEEVSARIFDLSKIDIMKYRWLYAAIITSVIAWVVAFRVAWVCARAMVVQQ